MFMAITGIRNLDIISGKLLAQGYVVATWTDALLKWNSSDFNGLFRFSILSEEIWVPSFVQFGTTESQLTLTPAWVREDGKVTWIVAGLFEGFCLLDVLRYPFDEHICEFGINPRAYDADEIQFKILQIEQDMDIFTGHGEWEITKSSSALFTFWEPISNTTFTGISRTLTVSRRYLFVLLHTGIPLLLLSLLNVAVFLVPLRSGERISFSTAILLNLVLFTTNISEELPHNSLRISYCSILMTCANIITALGVVFSVILCRIDQETIAPVPDRLKNFVNSFLSCRLRSRMQTSVFVLKEQDENNSDNADGVSYIGSAKPTHQPENERAGPSTMNISWSTVAEAFDVILFDLNLLIFVILLVVFSALLNIK